MTLDTVMYHLTGNNSALKFSRHETQPNIQNVTEVGTHAEPSSKIRSLFMTIECMELGTSVSSIYRDSAYYAKLPFHELKRVYMRLRVSLLIHIDRYLENGQVREKSYRKTNELCALTQSLLPLLAPVAQSRVSKMLSWLFLLVSSILVAAMPHRNQIVHQNRLSTRSRFTLGPESLARRDMQLIVSSVERLTDVQVVEAANICRGGPVQLPLSPGVPNPCRDMAAKQLELFTIPVSTPNKLTVVNYCSYEVFYVHEIPDASPERGYLLAGGSVSVDLRTSANAQGPVFKISKDGKISNPVNVEYSDRSYDLSLIPCLGTVEGKPNADTRACVGFEAGLQLSYPGGMSYQCAANTWCDDQAYFYTENLCKKNNPIRDFDWSEGLTMELCAGNKP
ncbi:hypothetical protein GMOD_00005641 [Pyrenophora seminiperda CCB06]|uniref:Uncharacterized protein n=1 Tax=Pyrenophora seminiperda CCB06 TaxID=1302712 RepID=A0A3M7M9E3_9PLEO|nr:hypothetical protein GMOD_00005641 [Pyrenophora seminiperda CCB06]